MQPKTKNHCIYASATFRIVAKFQCLYVPPSDPVRREELMLTEAGQNLLYTEELYPYAIVAERLEGWDALAGERWAPCAFEDLEENALLWLAQAACAGVGAPTPGLSQVLSAVEEDQKRGTAQDMNHPKGFVVVPVGKNDRRVLIAGPGPLLEIDAGPFPGCGDVAVAEAYARRIVEVLNASPMGQERRRS